MILQITNKATHDQLINLHTGQSMTISAGFGIKVDTGTDPRLAKYYASLINYNFDVTLLQASGNEANVFQDALDRLSEIKSSSQRAQSLQSNVTVPTVNTPHMEVPYQTPAPQPVTIDAVFNNEPMGKVVTNPVVDSQIPKVAYSEVSAKHNESIPDTTAITGAEIPNFTPEIPDDYPDNPNAIAELHRLEMQEQRLKQELNPDQAKYDALKEFDASKLKEILQNEFNESTSLRSVDKIVHHIVTLADDAGVDVLEVVAKYK